MGSSSSQIGPVGHQQAGQRQPPRLAGAQMPGLQRTDPAETDRGQGGGGRDPGRAVEALPEGEIFGEGQPRL